jgi:hypothetical protein
LAIASEGFPNDAKVIGANNSVVLSTAKRSLDTVVGDVGGCRLRPNIEAPTAYGAVVDLDIFLACLIFFRALVFPSAILGKSLVNAVLKDLFEALKSFQILGNVELISVRLLQRRKIKAAVVILNMVAFPFKRMAKGQLPMSVCD